MRGFFAALLLLVMVTATPAQAQRTEAEYIYCETLPGGLYATAEIYPPEFSDSADRLFYHDLHWYAWVIHYDHTGTQRGAPVATVWFNKPAGFGMWSPLSYHYTQALPFGAVAAFTYLFDATDQQWLYRADHGHRGPASGCPVR